MDEYIAEPQQQYTYPDEAAAAAAYAQAQAAAAQQAAAAVAAQVQIDNQVRLDQWAHEFKIPLCSVKTLIVTVKVSS